MFSAAWSQISSTGGWSVRSRGDSFLDPAVVNCYLTWCHSVHLSLVVDVGGLHVNFVEFSVCALHHIVVVDCRDVFGAASETFCGEDFLFGADDVHSLFGFVYLAFDHFEET